MHFSPFTKKFCYRFHRLTGMTSKNIHQNLLKRCNERYGCKRLKYGTSQTEKRVFFFLWKSSCVMYFLSFHQQVRQSRPFPGVRFLSVSHPPSNQPAIHPSPIHLSIHPPPNPFSHGGQRKKLERIWYWGTRREKRRGGLAEERLKDEKERSKRRGL